MTIAKIRGRNRGGGAEAAWHSTCDAPASRRPCSGNQRSVWACFPVAEHLSDSLCLSGAPALEIILGSDDLDAETAAQYGWINRGLPDDELDAFVDTFARRIASFDKAALAEAERLANRRTLPQAAVLIETQESFLARLQKWPSLQERGARLRATRS